MQYLVFLFYLFWLEGNAFKLSVMRNGAVKMNSNENTVSLFKYDPKKIRNFSIIAHIGNI